MLGFETSSLINLRIGPITAKVCIGHPPINVSNNNWKVKLKSYHDDVFLYQINATDFLIKHWY